MRRPEIVLFALALAAVVALSARRRITERGLVAVPSRGPRGRGRGRLGSTIRAIAIATAIAVIAYGLRGVAEAPGAQARVAGQTSSPHSGPSSPSGADPAYPPNHTMDGRTVSLGGPQNATFETAGGPVGSPPPNSGFETPPATALTVPNGDFATGDFTSWTTTGSPTMMTDPTRGYWARLSTGTSITTSALAIPSNGQALVYDVDYISTTTASAVDVYALTGPTFGTSTLIKHDSCAACGRWSTTVVDLSPYLGQTVKIKFSQSSDQVGVDAVTVQELFPGYQAVGTFKRLIDGGGNAYASVNSGGSLTSPAFSVDAAAQTGTVRVLGSTAGAQYLLYVAPGPSFSTWTQVAYGAGITTWTTARFNVANWRGQQVKVKVNANITGSMNIDDVGVQMIDVPAWDADGTPQAVDDGTGNHYVTTTGGYLTSQPLALPAGVQNLSLRLRSGGSSTGCYVDLLRGTGFSTVTTLKYLGAGATWQTVTVGVGPYAGETVKLRIRRSSGYALHVDDAGLLNSVLPGWTPTSTGPLSTGEDAHGTYAAPTDPQGGILLRSGWISTGIADIPSTVQSRYYAVSYDIGYSTGNLMQVFWYNDAGSSWTATQDAANQPTGYRTRFFGVGDFMGARGYFVVLLAGGGKVYSVADNVAGQQLSEPFSRKVGMGIDTSTGSVAFSDQDVALPGPLPMTFTRYYNAHSDRVGPLGYRWSQTYDTHLDLVPNGDVGVTYGSGREEFFVVQNNGTYLPADPRVHSALSKGVSTYTLTTKDNLTYTFTLQGSLSSIVDLNGNTLAMGYDGQGRLASVTGAGGRSLTMGYDAQSRLASLTDAAGAVYQYGYDANGDLATVADPTGGVRTYAYSHHRLTQVTNENGKAEVSNTYDDFSRVTSQTDALGRTITIAYDTPGRGATQVTDPQGGVATFYFDRFQRTTDAVDPSGNVITYIYDSNGNLDKIIDPANNAWDFAFASTGDLTSTTDPLGNPTSIVYNPRHLPTTVTDGRGNTTTMTYDGAGNLLTVTDPLGGRTTYTYDAMGNVLSVTDPLNRTTTYTYDPAGDRISKTDPASKTWTYTYDSDGNLTSKTDPLGGVTRYFYDLANRIMSIRDPLNRQTIYLYDAVGHLLMAEDPLGHRTLWAYDDRGLVRTKTDHAGGVTTYGYDANRNMTSVTDPLGRTTAYGFDSANRLTSVTDPLGDQTAYTYDDAGRVASQTDPLGRLTTYAYDENSRLSAITLPNGATIAYGRDADGNVTAVTDQLAHVTANVYDALNRLVSATDPLGRATSYTYDAAGELTSETDPLGHTTSHVYDADGRLVSTTDPLGNVTQSGYDADGRLTSQTDPTSRTTAYGYDAAGQLLTVTDPAGNVTTSGYDIGGRLASVQLPSGATTTYGYDPMGRMTSEADSLGHTTTYGYDAAGQQTSQTDPMNRTTTYGYDAAGRQTAITDALGGVVGLGYDAAGQLTSVTDPLGNAWIYGYDSLGQRVSVTDPLNRTTSYGYDPAGQQTSRTDARGIATAYGHDAAGQVTSATYPGGSIAYGYDAAGRRTSMTDTTGTTTTGYDAASRVTSVASPEGPITYGYDGAGRRTTMTLPSARTVTYGYDGAGRLSSLQDWAGRTTTFGYDADGNRTSITRPNGVTSTYGYDAAGRVTSITHARGAQTLLQLTYARNANGDPTSVTTGSGAESYDYDSLHRLTRVTYPDGSSTSYTYDAAGNRTTDVSGDITTNYAYDQAGELTAQGTRSYGHDANGNVTSAGSDHFSWDWDNRLTSATVGLHSATDTYDGEGNRVGATVDGLPKSYLVDREADLPTLVDDGTTSYLNADGYLGEVTGPVALYGLNDALGSVRGLTDLTGTLVGTTSYEPFGKTRSQLGASSLMGFTGEPTDATSLVYLRARSLDPASGRMLSADTVRPNAPGTQGYNLYTYGADDPTRWADPTGHSTSGELDPRTADLLAAFVASAVLLLAVACEIALFPTVVGAVACGPAVLINLVFVILIAVLYGLLSQIQQLLTVVAERGSTSFEGVIHWTAPQLRTAPSDFPTLPPAPVGIGGKLEPQYVVRGGTNTLELWQKQPIDDNNLLIGSSVNTAPGVPLLELCRPWDVRKYPKVGVTTLDRVLSMGGMVIPSPTPDNPYHADLSGITPLQAYELFYPPIDNPAR